MNTSLKSNYKKLICVQILRTNPIITFNVDNGMKTLNIEHKII